MVLILTRTRLYIKIEEEICREARGGECGGRRAYWSDSGNKKELVFHPCYAQTIH